MWREVLSIVVRRIVSGELRTMLGGARVEALFLKPSCRPGDWSCVYVAGVLRIGEWELMFNVHAAIASFGFDKLSPTSLQTRACQGRSSRGRVSSFFTSLRQEMDVGMIAFF